MASYPASARNGSRSSSTPTTSSGHSPDCRCRIRHADHWPGAAGVEDSQYSGRSSLYAVINRPSRASGGSDVNQAMADTIGPLGRSAVARRGTI
jgi:hypothetical protein